MARRSSQKSRRDPNAPQKPKTAYALFALENREEVKKQNPGLNGYKINTKLGELWRQTDDAAKRRYQKQYQSSQAEYDEKYAAYKEEKNKKRQSSNSKKNQGQSKKGNNNDNDESTEYADQM